MKKEKYFGSFAVKYLKGQRKVVVLLGIFFISNIVLNIAAPQILSYFIDSAESGRTMEYIIMIVLIYIGTIILKIAAGHMTVF